MIVLDLMLPGMDGFEVCKKIREESNTPILIVSAKTDKEDKLNGLVLGADDYIEKPYDIDIMLAKIDGIFKRRYALDEITDGTLRINRESRTVYKNNSLLELKLEKKHLKNYKNFHSRIMIKHHQVGLWHVLQVTQENYLKLYLGVWYPNTICIRSERRCKW